MDYQDYQNSALNSYYNFRLTSPCPPPSPFFLKIKFIHAYIFRHANCGIQAFKNLKSTINAVLYKKTRGITKYIIKLRGANNMKMKEMKEMKAVNSITVRMNYSSLHILPVGDQAYYDADWNSVIPSEEIMPLSGYLEWLEDRNSDETTNNDENDDGDDGCNDGSDINRRAESFIARCYEKFKLEKQDSCRRYQEMMARSL